MFNVEWERRRPRHSTFNIEHSTFNIFFSYRSPRVMTNSSNVDRYSSGVKRMAAPVGQLRTHAGPPEISRHRSHFTAAVCSTSLLCSFPNSDATHEKMVFFGSLWIMKMLP